MLITGAGGQLATALVASAPNGVSVVAVSRSDLDVTDSNLTIARIGDLKPDVIINTAAYTAVDLAESNADDANAVNVAGARHIAEAADLVDARLIQISTDFVFDGQSELPYLPDDKTAPQSVYGQTKLEGERAVREILGDNAVILRSSWLYSGYGKNFVTTMMELMKSRDSIAVVNDQSGSPTWAASLAKVVYRLASDESLGGTWHWSDAGVTTWHDFAVGIQDEALDAGILEKRIPIHPCTSEEFGAAATRPAFSALNVSATEHELGMTAAHWRDNLRKLIRAMKKP